MIGGEGVILPMIGREGVVLPVMGRVGEEYEKSTNVSYNSVQDVEYVAPLQHDIAWTSDDHSSLNLYEYECVYYSTHHR